jgi:hypothetical protein
LKSSFYLCFCNLFIINLADRAENVEISIAVEYGEWTVVASKEGPMGASATLTFDPVEARYVRTTLRDKETWLHFCEVEIYGSGKSLFMLENVLNKRLLLQSIFYL